MNVNSACVLNTQTPQNLNLVKLIFVFPVTTELRHKYYISSIIGGVISSVNFSDLPWFDGSETLPSMEFLFHR